MLLVPLASLAATLTVGPTGDHATPCAAVAAAAAGDVIEIDAAGDYAGDTCAWSTDALTLRGVNGRPVLDGTGVSLAQQKGIFVIQAPTATIENLTFVGAAVPDQNGAGIRHQGTDLVVRDCVFRDNENGILGSPPADHTGSVTIERSEFEHNGHGDGYSHNVYLGRYDRVTVRSTWSHRGNVGHLFKSRADHNLLVASRFTDEDGAASYEIDLPEAGDAWVVGCVVEQGPGTENSAIVSYGAEGVGPDPSAGLHVVNSTLLNHAGRGTFVQVGGSVTTPAQLVNTVFAGGGTLSGQASAVFTACWDDGMGDAGLVDPDALDVHLLETSPCVDAGVDPGVDLAAYLHPSAEEARTRVGAAWDIGAYEFGVPEDTGTTPGDDTGTKPGDDTGTPTSDDTAAPTDDTGAEADADGGCGCAASATPASLALAPLAAALISRRRRRT